MELNLLDEDRDKEEPTQPELSQDISMVDNFRFGQTEAFYFLFAVSFGPAFIAIDLSTSVTEIKTGIFFVIFLIILLVYLMNQTAVYMLSEVYRITKLGSYQEIGYKTSKSNPGYIYMISIIKSVYLAVTCAYCIQFVTSYPVSLVVMLWPNIH